MFICDGPFKLDGDGKRAQSILVKEEQKRSGIPFSVRVRQNVGGLSKAETRFQWTQDLHDMPCTLFVSF